MFPLLDCMWASAQLGFSAPILHGLCTLGMSVKAVTDTLLDGEPERLRSVKVHQSWLAG
jgi:acyl dehydratase